MEILTKINLKCTKIGTISGDVILPDVENADNPVKIAAVKDIPVKVYDGNSYYLNGCLENGDGTEFGCLNVGGLGVHGCLNVDGSLCVSGVVSAERIDAGYANFSCARSVEFSYPPKYTGEYIDSETGAAVFNCSDQFITKCYVDQLNTCVREVLDTKANASDVYTKTQVDTKLATKANSATTLSGYGIGDAYTKTEVDTALATKANKATTLSGYCITDAYTKTCVNSLLDTKANVSDVYTQEEVTALLKTKANTSHTHAIGAIEGLDAKLTCLSGCKVETSTLNSHTGTKATTTTFGHVRLATGLADAGDHAVPRAQIVKDYLTNNYYTQSDTISCICVMIDSHNTWCTAHGNLFSQKADVCHTHAISSIETLSDKLACKVESSVFSKHAALEAAQCTCGHVRLATSMADTGTIAVPTAKMVKDYSDTRYIIGGTINCTTTDSAIAIGYNSKVEANSTDGVAIGADTRVSGNEAVAIGNGAYTDGCGAISIGCIANSIGESSIAIGAWSYADGCAAVAIGFCTKAIAHGSIVLGCGARLYGTSSEGGIAIGVNSSVEDASPYAVSVGANTHGCSYAVALGSFSKAENNAIVLNSTGTTKVSADSNTFNVFTGGGLSGFYVDGESLGSKLDDKLDKACTAIGISASAPVGGISIGNCSRANAGSVIAIGTHAGARVDSSYENTISIGSSSRTEGVASISIGCNAYVGTDSDYAVAIGASSRVLCGSCGGVSIGDSSSSGQMAVALGYGACAADWSITVGSNGSAGCANSIVLDSSGSYCSAWKSSAIGRTFNVFTGGSGGDNICTTSGIATFDSFNYNGQSLGCVLKELKSEIPYCSTYSISSSSASALADGRKYIDVTIANLGTQNSNICTTSAYIEVPVNASVYATTGSGMSYSGSYIYPEITWSGTAASKANCVRLIFDEEMLTENSTVAVKVSGIRNS